MIESSAGGLLNYLVVAPDKKDSSSILRILKTISSCLPHCSFAHSAEPFLQTILHILLKAEALSIKYVILFLFSFFTVTHILLPGYMSEISGVHMASEVNLIFDLPDTILRTCWLPWEKN